MDPRSVRWIVREGAVTRQLPWQQEESPCSWSTRTAYRTESDKEEGGAARAPAPALPREEEEGGKGGAADAQKEREEEEEPPKKRRVGKSGGVLRGERQARREEEEEAGSKSWEGGSDTLDTTELTEAMSAMGQRPSPAEVDALMKECDHDKNGVCELDEFEHMVRPLLSPSRARALSLSPSSISTFL